jgi:hypothetical protein
MKRTLNANAGRRLAVTALSAASTLGSAAVVSAAVVVTLDFEGVPATYNHDGVGQNLGAYYAKPASPTFGPQATVLEVGGSLNSVLYPPNSGIGVLWGDLFDIELSFTSGLAQGVSLSYRSNADMYLFAYDALDNLLDAANGPASLGSDPVGFLALNHASYDIARVLISGPAGAFTVDDVTYIAVPEPAALALVAGLGLAGFACWRRRGG